MTTLADEVEALCPCTYGGDPGPNADCGFCVCCKKEYPHRGDANQVCCWPGHDLARRVGEMEKRLESLGSMKFPPFNLEGRQ